MAQDFFQSYLEYTSGGEVPICFHRWAAIVGIGTILERNVFLQFGNGFIYPNMYAMLIGNAGTKKSTAIKTMKKLLVKAGYTTIAAERTSKEKYLADLSSQQDATSGDESVLEKNIFGAQNDDIVTPNLIAADEANDFFGIGNIEFLSVLGSLWDWEGKYENRIKTGKSDFISNPTISILAGNTPIGFATAFPSSIFGQGFFSRLLLVYSEPTGVRVTLPRTPSTDETAHVVRLLSLIRSECSGLYKWEPSAYALLDKIYQIEPDIADIRFESYYNRRHTHLQKLCLIMSCARLGKSISERDVLQANTYLRYIENLMPKALGEFGKARNSDLTHKISTLIETKFPISLKDIVKEVSSEIEKMEDVGQIIRKLLMAEKIVQSTGLFLPKKKVHEYEDEEKEGLVAYDEFLTPQELGRK